MIQIIKEKLGRKYYPLNKITISKSALVNNYKTLTKINPKIKIAPVLKSNAYGHGVRQIAKIVDNLNPPFVCVDSIYEAYELVKNGIKSQILIMGYINPKNLEVKKLPFAYAVYGLDQLEAINKYQRGAEVHLKVDTGMHRMGIPLDELPDFIVRARSFNNIKIVGLMSHFASADEPKSSLLKQQIENFNVASKICEQKNLNLKWKHIGASDALLNIPNLADFSNLARVGIALYGTGTNEESLQPALELKSQIVQIKKLKPGDMVGYSGTFTAKKTSVIGVLPIGYNDGVDRRLSNIGMVKVKNIFCPIIGRISMNITTIDLSRVINPKIGDEVLIYSKNLKDNNTLSEIAKKCSTIPHEILVHLNPTSIQRQVNP